MPRLPLTEMKAHILTLCADNLITVMFVKPHQKCQADLDKHIIIILPIRSTISYVVALHELGHLLDKNALKAKNVLRCEALAWRWAKKNAILWNATATKHRDACLQSYLESESKPPANSVFWKVYQQ